MVHSVDINILSIFLSNSSNGSLPSQSPTSCRLPRLLILKRSTIDPHRSYANRDSTQTQNNREGTSQLNNKPTCSFAKVHMRSGVGVRKMEILEHPLFNRFFGHCVSHCQEGALSQDGGLCIKKILSQSLTLDVNTLKL